MIPHHTWINEWTDRRGKGKEDTRNVNTKEGRKERKGVNPGLFMPPFGQIVIPSFTPVSRTGTIKLRHPPKFLISMFIFAVILIVAMSVPYRVTSVLVVPRASVLISNTPSPWSTTVGGGILNDDCAQMICSIQLRFFFFFFHRGGEVGNRQKKTSRQGLDAIPILHRTW